MLCAIKNNNLLLRVLQPKSEKEKKWIIQFTGRMMVKHETDGF